MATTDEINRWAQSIGLQACVGAEFNAQYGRLPISIPELTDWGNKTGRRDAAGNWTCLGTSGGGGGGGGGIIPGASGTFGQIGTWIQQNGIIAIGVVFGAVLLLRKK